MRTAGPPTDPPPLQVRTATAAPELDAARALLVEYGASLGPDLDTAAFAADLHTFPLAFTPPRGGLLLAHWSDALVGCVALRTCSPAIAELCRMYVRPAFRRRGAGRALLEAAGRWARAAGHRRIRLETAPSLRAAQALYAAAGFRRIPPYEGSPADAVCFERELADERI